MLGAFRSFAKSWLAKILFGVLALAFVGWGASGSSQLRGAISTDVVIAGKHKLDGPSYKRLFTNALQSNQQQGQQLSAQDAVQGGLDKQLLAQIGQLMSLWETIRRLGLQPSDKLVIQEIAKQREFANPVTGKFDPNQYRRVLAENGYATKADQTRFEQQIIDRVATDQFASGLLAGVTPPKLYGVVLASGLIQSRDVEYFSVPISTIGQVAPPTDAQLTAFMTQYAAQLKRPEVRVISLVRLSQAAFAPTVAVNEAEVQKTYETRKGQMSTPEKRAFVQVTLRNPADGPAMTARLARGEDPAAAAKALGGQAITYPDTEKPTIPDPAIADAVFRLQAGQTSGVITGSTGASIVRVVRITPAHTKSLAEARGDIEQELRQGAARQRVFDMARKYGDAHDSGADLARAAQAAGAQIYTVGPVTAQGQDGAGRPNPSLTPDMLKQAFSKPQGGETDLVDIGGGEYYALRVDRVMPSALPPLNEVRPMLTQVWMRQEIGKRIQARADGLIAQVKAGKSMDAVAASVGAHVERVADLSRFTAQQHQALGASLMQTVMGAKPGEVFTAGGADGKTLLIARLTAVRPGNPGYIAQIASMTGSRVVQAMSEELQRSIQAEAERRIKPRIDRKKGLTAIGVDPATVPDLDAKAAPAKAGKGGGAPLAK